MVELRWKFYSEARPEKEYLALVTYLPLKHFWKVPSFIRMFQAVQHQLSRSEGLIGYSMIAKFLGRRFWSLSVWEDEKALTDFVMKIPHKDIMVSLGGQLNSPRFVRWKIAGSAVPPSWDEAYKQLEKN